jgi:para-aminobenzoate synthetase component 1
MAATLRRRAPAPHAVWLGGRSRPDGPVDRSVLGNSPERFLGLAPDGTVKTCPIKGTRPRGRDPAADAAARAALLASPKDRAEHVMIVDLERNDLGRVAVPGSVVVEGLSRIVELPTVFHLATTVRARLRSGVGLAALLRATFPGGSVTGAPKRRAMEIIDELEPVARGIYTGATGWLGAAGDLDLGLAIRTAVIQGGQFTLFVGGGIVADSDPSEELVETEVKARAFQTLWAPV